MSNNRVVTGDLGFFICSKMFTSVCYESMGDDMSMDGTQQLPIYQVSLDNISFRNVEVLAGPGNVVWSRRTNIVGITPG